MVFETVAKTIVGLPTMEMHQSEMPKHMKHMDWVHISGKII